MNVEEKLLQVGAILARAVDQHDEYEPDFMPLLDAIEKALEAIREGLPEEE